MADLTDTSVMEWALEIDYDDSLMDLISNTRGEEWWYEGGYPLSGSRFNLPYSGSLVKLATLKFECEGPGASMLTLNGLLDDGAEAFVYYSLDVTASYYDWDYEPGVVNQEPIPEPTTMLLLGAGLIGLAGLGRKKMFRKG